MLQFKNGFLHKNTPESFAINNQHKCLIFFTLSTKSDSLNFRAFHRKKNLTAEFVR